MSVQSSTPREAQLIRERREAAEPPVSRRQAAAKAGISPSQWSDIERGSKKAGQGTTIPIRATPETLALMAQAVGATADDLSAAGRQDAATLLHTIDEDRKLRHRFSAVPGLGSITWPPHPGADMQELLPAIAAGLDAIEASGLAEAARRELTSMYVGNLLHDAARRHAELLLLLRIATGRDAEPR